MVCRAELVRGWPVSREAPRVPRVDQRRPAGGTVACQPCTGYRRWEGSAEFGAERAALNERLSRRARP